MLSGDQKLNSPIKIEDEPIFSSTTIEECMIAASLNRNSQSVEDDKNRLNIWVDGIKQHVPLERIDEKLHPLFTECNHQCSFPFAGTLFFMGNIIKEGLVVEDTHSKRKNEYFIFSKSHIVHIETNYTINYLNSILPSPCTEEEIDPYTQYGFRARYDVKIMPEKLPFSIQDNTFYFRVDSKSKCVNYAVRSPTGQEIISFIKLEKLNSNNSPSESELFKKLPLIFEITAKRGHTHPLIPIAKSVTISFIHLVEKNSLDEEGYPIIKKEPVIKVLKHVRFVLDEKNNDILFSNEQKHVFKRFDSSLEEVELEADFLIKSNLFVKDKQLSLNDPTYKTPDWLIEIKAELCKKVDEAQNIKHLKSLLFKLYEGYLTYLENQSLAILVSRFLKHIDQLELSGSDQHSLVKDLRCITNAIINDTSQNLFKLHHRVETNLATRNKQVISATVATVATSLCVVGGLTLFAPATLPAMAAVTVAGLATAGAGAAGTKKVKDTAEEKRVTPATYEEEILNNLLQQYVDNEDYGKFVLFEWELIKSSIASRGVKNKARDDLIAHYEAKLKGFRGDVTQTTNFLVNCRDALLKQNPTSETAKEITNLITKLSNHHFLSLMKKEFDYEHYTSYMLLRLNNIMANAKLRKADTKRDKILQSLVSFIEEFDFIPSQKPDFKDDISDCVKKLRALSRNSTTAIELEQLQSELSIYAERYKAPERSCTTTTTMSCGK